MTKKDEREIIKHEGDDALAPPDYLKGERGHLGFEGMDSGDITLPRLALCQSQTPQRKRGDTNYIEGLEEGEYFNTITGENMGMEVLVTPLMFYKTRIRFAPIDSGGGILCQSRDFLNGVGTPGGDCLKCPLATFQGDKKPDCNKFFNYPALAWKEGEMPKPGGLLVVSFKSTALKAASAWNSLMQIRRANMFTGVYRFTSVQQTNSTKQSWYTPVIKNAGWVPEQIINLMKELYNAVSTARKEGRLSEHMEDLAGSGTTYEGEM